MIVTQSSRIRKLIKTTERIARTSASVLITGPSGTGKELFARLVHDSSLRAGRAFVKVNCAALPSSLVESEFFGHEKGSFTDAVQSRIGRFAKADQGTLLLDEISEIPLATQAKLLRVLEENEFERVGSDETVGCDVRVVATSNRCLKNEIKKGNFREDLYHRLSVIPISVPSLADRKEDIPILAMHFVSKFKSENDVQVRGFTKTAMKRLASYTWPGNIRELRNCIHRACILTTKPLIDTDCLVLLEDHIPEPQAELPEAWLQTKLADLEQKIIVAAIKKYQNKRIVAEKLGVSSRTLTNKLKIYREEGQDTGEAA